MKRYLITSALPYINGVKHLGNLVGSMLPADIYARYLRQRGHEVLFICATDEHGTPAELAAKSAGLPVADYCREQHDIQKAIYAKFLLSFDHFGRTSSPQNHALTQHFGDRLAERGLVDERIVKQVYSSADGRFLPYRYVVGTCPYCGNTDARGDQCENCTKLLDPLQLIDARSAVSGSRDIEVRETRHLYLLQSRLSGQVREWIETKSSWPTLTTSIALKWLDEGLEDRGITRDLEWGVPVTRPGYEDKVYYVWFDAPIGYIGATKEWADLDPATRDWKTWWLDAEDVTYTQFMAKDNVPFHTVMFPATILGTGEPWKLADYIKGVNWLNYYGGKFSTSRQYGVFMDSALELLPADYWRYFLIANAPESDDTSFTWELFSAQVNKDLADTLGNFVNRVLTFTLNRFGPTVPEGGEAGQPEQRLARQLADAIAGYESSLDNLHLRKAAAQLRSIWSLGNSYIELKAPWQEIKADPSAAALTMRTAMGLIRIFGQLSAPIIPATAAQLESVFSSLSAPSPGEGNQWPSQDLDDLLGAIPPGTAFEVPDVLFRKITDEEVTQWRERFGAD
jgi:methionyl-tRNA synthetase